MKYRRARCPVVRRLITGLMAAMIGGVGSLAIATPSQAATTCELTYTVDSIGNPTFPQYLVKAKIKNTGVGTSARWGGFISYPTGANIFNWWAMRKAVTSPYAYLSVDINKAILPGEVADFGWIVATPVGVGGTPTSFVCNIFY